MADSDLLVTISGAALSLLFYENVRSVGDQMGFLLGESLEFVIKTYTDSDRQVETVKIRNNIETIVTCPLPDPIHDSTGRINKAKIQNFLCDNSKQVIGWFRFRRNTNLELTMRDKILHKEFASYFSKGNGSKAELFVTCLLNSAISAERGTHKFRHVFFRQKRGLFEPIPLRIINLGNDLFRNDSDYKPTPTKKSLRSPDVFTKLIQSLNLDFKRMTGLESAIIIQKTGEQYLNELITEVCKSDLEVAQLEKQVRELKKAKFKDSFNAASPNLERELDGACSVPKEQTVDKPCWILETSISDLQFSRKTKSAAAFINENLHKNKLKNRLTDTATLKTEEPFKNSFSETKVNFKDNVSIRSSYRPTRMVSEISKESICKGPAIECGISRGRGKLMNDSNPGLKKLTTRNSSERNTHKPQLFENESSSTN